jgi:large subunit ribosomal protein L30
LRLSAVVAAIAAGAMVAAIAAPAAAALAVAGRAAGAAVDAPAGAPAALAARAPAAPQEDKPMPAKKTVQLVQPETVVAEAVGETAPAPQAETVAETSSGPRLRITLCKSGTGYKYDQKQTLVALGLRRLNTTVVRPDNPSVRGMLTKVQHLVRVEEIG